MTTPYVANVNFDVQTSISIQNRTDAGGNVVTYLLFKPGTVANMQMRKANLDDYHAELVFQLSNVESIVALTASLSSAYASKTVTGSY